MHLSQPLCSAAADPAWPSLDLVCGPEQLPIGTTKGRGSCCLESLQSVRLGVRRWQPEREEKGRKGRRGGRGGPGLLPQPGGHSPAQPGARRLQPHCLQEATDERSRSTCPRSLLLTHMYSPGDKGRGWVQFKEAPNPGPGRLDSTPYACPQQPGRGLKRSRRLPPTVLWGGTAGDAHPENQVQKGVECGQGRWKRAG